LKDDLVLIKEVLDGNRDAFTLLIEKYKDKIFNYSYRLSGNRNDAEDIVQDTFINAYSHLDKFKIEYKFSTWLFTIATNITKNKLKRKKVICYTLDVPVDTENDEHLSREQVMASPDTAESNIESEEKSRFVSEMLNWLPEKYRVPFLLKHKEEYSYEEIAGMIKESVSTVKIRIYRAREMLTGKFKDRM